MAEDFSDKTEEPTPKKLADARQKGFVAKSQDMTIGVVLLMTMIMMFFLAGFMYERIAVFTVGIFSNLNMPIDNMQGVVSWLRKAIVYYFLTLLPLNVGVLLVALVVNFAQVGFNVSFYPLIPNWNRINFFHSANLERIIGMKAMLRLILGLIRINLSFFLAWFMIGADMSIITKMGHTSIAKILLFIERKVLVVAMVTSACYILVAMVDLVYQRWRFKREMKMSRRELKEETKQLEGDVKVKEKIRRMMRSFVHDNLKKTIPEASLVVFHPGKYAVGLKYQPDKMAVPICLFKGFGKKSDSILAAAKKNGVPIIKNPKLAKDLFAELEPDFPIAPAHYVEVAEILKLYGKHSELRRQHEEV